jgi:hypothetical protein
MRSFWPCAESFGEQLEEFLRLQIMRKMAGIFAAIAGVPLGPRPRGPDNPGLAFDPRPSTFDIPTFRHSDIPAPPGCD